MFLYRQGNNENIKVKAEKLKFHVEKISKEFFPRNSANIVNLDKTANYIQDEFKKAGGKVSTQIFEANGNKYRNIVAIFGAETSERIVVGAHYDAAGNTPAADDNASGVAGLIELAYLLGQTEKLPMQIELVAFTLEEPPFFGTNKMGSYIHAESLSKQNIKIRLMISLEMIGYFSDKPGSQDFPISLMSLCYPTTGNFITVIGTLNDGLSVRNFKNSMLEATDLPVYSINAPSFINGIDFSDHRNYWKFGYRAVMITDTAFYRNPFYHSPLDTAEKLDYHRMSLVVQSVYQAVLETTS